MSDMIATILGWVVGVICIVGVFTFLVLAAIDFAYFTRPRSDEDGQ